MECKGGKMTFVDFVKSRRKALKSTQQEIEVVFGNEACDLDSAVSALSYSYLLQESSPDSVKSFIPILNIPSEEFRLKTEVVFVLASNGLTKDDFLFADDPLIENIIEQKSTNLNLVDHNVLSDSQAHMMDRVVSIVDHHKQECNVRDGMFVRIEMTGSCCTLVADIIYQRLGKVSDPTLAQLLRGVILCDSICLDVDQGKTTPLDTSVVERLEAEHGLLSEHRQFDFSEINTAKNDVSGLTTEELLRKDMKIFTVSSRSVIMSSITIHLQRFLEREDVVSKLDDALEARGAQLIALICCGDGEVSYEKHLVLYTPDKKLKHFLTHRIDMDGKLELSSLPASHLDIPTQLVVRKFSNIKLSRKQVMPQLKEHIQVLTTSEALSSRLHTDSDQLTFTLDLSSPGTPAILESPAPELESSYENSGTHTPNPHFSVGAPPNSYIESGCMPDNRLLPSFNNSEMVKRIMIKKNKLGSSDELLVDQTSGAEVGRTSCPFTPVNSFVDSFQPQSATDHHLPTFNSREMVDRILVRKSQTEQGSDACIKDMSGMDSPEVNPSVPFTPQNSIRDVEFMYPSKLDETELEQRLIIMQSAESPDKSSCGTPQRLQLAANSLIDNLLEQAVSKVRLDDQTNSPA